MRAKKVNEGTWAIPNSKEKRTHQGLLFISKIEKLKKELLEYFIDNEVDPNIAQDLVEHREGFLTYGLDIQ